MNKLMRLLLIPTCMIYCCSPQESTNEGAQKPKYELIEPQEVTESAPRIYCGIFEPESVIRLSSLSGGRVLSTPSLPGKRIKTGEVLIVLENRELEWDLREQEGILQAARKELSHAERDLNNVRHEASRKLIEIENRKLDIRLKRHQLQEEELRLEGLKALVELGGVPEAEIRAAENRIQMINIEIEVVENRLKGALLGLNPYELKKEYPEDKSPLAEIQIRHLCRNATEQLERQRQNVRRYEENCRRLTNRIDELTIRSPVDAKLLKMDVQQGEVITSGRELASLAVDTRLRAAVKIDRADAFHFKKGHELKLEVYKDPDNPERCQYEIIGFSPLLETTTGEMLMMIRTDNSRQHYMAGDYFEIQYATPVERKWKVPLSAVSSEPDGRFIFILTGEEIHRLPVSGKESDGAFLLIEKPPEVIAPVINYPPAGLTEGSRLSHLQPQAGENNDGN